MSGCQPILLRFRRTSVPEAVVRAARLMGGIFSTPPTVENRTPAEATSVHILPARPHMAKVPGPAKLLNRRMVDASRARIFA